MSPRRVTAGRLASPVVPDYLPVSARIAWSYLATLGALVVAAGTVVVGNASVGTVGCRADLSDVADCRLGWAVVFGLAGMAIGWVLLGLLLRLGWRFGVAATALGALLVSVDRLETWWWWLLAGLIPAVAALASHGWGSTRRTALARDLGLGVLGVAALGALAWWLVR